MSLLHLVLFNTLIIRNLFTIVCMANYAVSRFTYGGLEYRFIDVPQEDYFCSTCSILICDAYQSMCSCAKLYCQKCEQGFKQCTKCHEQPELFCDRNATRRIRNLRIECTSDGCPWVGVLGEHQEHLLKCDYLPVICGNGCGSLLPRTLHEKHLAEDCVLRLHACPHCNVVDTYQTVVGEHLESCSHVFCPCPNQECTETCKRKDMDYHLSSCRKEVIACTFSKVGCTFKGQRENMNDHCEKSACRHMELEMQMREQENRALKDKLDVLQAQLEASKQTITLTSIHVRRGIQCKVIHGVGLKFLSFSEHKESGKAWHSPSFHTHQRGINVRLTVYANGFKDGDGRYVSVYITLMKGIYDDEISWPMCGAFQVTLLNQVRDENHRQGTIPVDSWNRVTEHEHQKGYSMFVPYVDLRRNDETQYLMNDTLYFRVEAAIGKPWLATIN